MSCNVHRRATLGTLAARPYDVLVVGGGIYGAMAAREAALRGFRTALVERDDFGGGTSFNSLKIMHGGIRYVQHLDVARLRASARERAFWARAAPELVRPLDFVVPLFGLGLKGPGAFSAASGLYTALSTGLRGAGYDGAGIIGAAEARRRMGEFAPQGMIAGGVWRDGQITDANRLQLAVLRAATQNGADIANYIEVSHLLQHDGKVCGAAVTDRTTGRSAEIAANVVLCCAGDATGRLVEPLRPPQAGRRLPSFIRAMNLVLRRQIGSRAIGIVGQEPSDAVFNRGGRMYFLTPWAEHTIVGTHETGLRGESPDMAAARFLAILNRSCPALNLREEDVVHVYDGVIPAKVDDARSAGAGRMTRGTLIDHSTEGILGLISVVGVKYTTARMIAGRALDLASTQIGRGPAPAEARRISLGTVLPRVTLSAVSPFDHDALTERFSTAIREEMAITVDDLLWRRTTLGETGVLSDTEPAERSARIRALAEALGARNECVQPVPARLTR